MKLSRFFLAMVVSGLAILMVVTFLPHDPYVRYQRLSLGSHAKAQWIYERTVFDDKPIDFAFFGTSHTMNGIDSGFLQFRLSKEYGMQKNVVNFAIPNFGRDMHYFLTKLLLQHKKPEAVFLEIREIESRDMHPASHYLADSWDLLSAPLLVNTRYAGNLVRLPLRQSELFIQSHLPFLFNVETEEPAAQAAIPSHNDLAIYYKTNGVRRDKVVELDQLLRSEEKWNKVQTPKLSRDSSLQTFVNFNASFHYVKKIAELAEANDVKLIFVYIPEYGSRETSVDEAFYQQFGPILYVDKGKVFDNTEHWYDHGHLNSYGAESLTENVARKIDTLSLMPAPEPRIAATDQAVKSR